MVSAMLRYCYCADLRSDPDDTSSMILDIHLFIMADKYRINGLKIKTASQFRRSCEDDWDTTDFVKAISLVYTAAGNTEPLKLVLLEIIQQHREELLQNPDRYNAFHKALIDVPGLVFDVVTRTSPADVATPRERSDRDVWQFHCPVSGCECVFELSIGQIAKQSLIACPRGHHKGSLRSWNPFGRHIGTYSCSNGAGRSSSDVTES